MGWRFGEPGFWGHSAADFGMGLFGPLDWVLEPPSRNVANTATMVRMNDTDNHLGIALIRVNEGDNAQNRLSAAIHYLSAIARGVLHLARIQTEICDELRMANAPLGKVPRRRAIMTSDEEYSRVPRRPPGQTPISATSPGQTPIQAEDATPDERIMAKIAKEYPRETSPYGDDAAEEANPDHRPVTSEHSAGGNEPVYCRCGVEIRVNIPRSGGGPQTAAPSPTASRASHVCTGSSGRVGRGGWIQVPNRRLSLARRVGSSVPESVTGRRMSVEGWTRLFMNGYVEREWDEGAYDAAAYKRVVETQME